MLTAEVGGGGSSSVMELTGLHGLLHQWEGNEGVRASQKLPLGRQGRPQGIHVTFPQFGP